MNKLSKMILSITTIPVLLINPSNNGNNIPKFSSLSKSNNIAKTSNIQPNFSPIEIVDEPIKATKQFKGASENLDDDYPESFDLRDNGMIQAVKDQGSYGTCWCQTAVDSAETSILRRVPDINLSELQIAFYSYFGEDQKNLEDAETAGEHFAHGGNSYSVSNLWAQWKGPVLEEYIPYHSDIYDNPELQQQYINYADYHLENAYIFNPTYGELDSLNNTVKSFLLNNQAVDISYRNDYSSYNSDYHSFYYNGYEVANHSVTIIGWDDNFPSTHFNEDCQPENNGAWLAKNSWGADWEDCGYFWISYEDSSLCEFSVFELGDKDNYQNIYQHDTFFPEQSFSLGETSYMANVFTAESNELLDAVSTYFILPDIEYRFSIYTDLKNDSPTSGKLVYEGLGQNTVTGYHTLELDSSIELSEGEKFSVVFALTNSLDSFTIPVESAVALVNPETQESTSLYGYYSNYDKIKAFTNSNESFYSEDGEYWADVIDEDYIYSDEEKQELYESILEGDNEEYIEKYKPLFDNCDVILKMGNFPIKAFTNPINKVEFSHTNGYVYDNETVTISSYNNDDIYYSINESEYVLYTNPIAITEECTISATTDFETIFTKNYQPAVAMLSSLSYQEILTFYEATKLDSSTYEIYIAPNISEIKLLPVGQGTITINGERCKSGTATNGISLENGLNTVNISIQLDNAQTTDITVNIIRGSISTILIGDVNLDGIIDSFDSSLILEYYATISSNKESYLTDEQIGLADYNRDYIIDAFDASLVLEYYARKSSGG